MKRADISENDNESIKSSSKSSSKSSNSSAPEEKNLQKNILIFHEQMNRYLLSNPELKNLDFEKVVDPHSLNQQNDASKMWNKITQNILIESKRSTSLPSIEHFTQRLNLFQKEDETPDIIDILLSQNKFLQAQIKKEEDQKLKAQKRLNQSIKEKLNKETGLLGGNEKDEKFYSQRKNQEFDQRMKEERRKALEKSKKKINSLEPQIKSVERQILVPKKKKIEKKQVGGNVYERLVKDPLKAEVKEENSINNNDYSLDINFKHVEPEKLYRKIKKCENESQAKKMVLEHLTQHRQKHYEEFKNSDSILQQGQKFFSDDSKEFTLFSINFDAKKKMAQKGIHEDPNFFQDRSNLEQGNTYMLTKVNQILEGNLMKKWKQLQEQKF